MIPVSSSPRPRIAISRTPLDNFLEIIGVAGIIATIAGLVLVWPSLPQRVPQHFDFAGHVDKWGDKSVIILLPLIGTVVYIGLTMLMRLPHIFNYPVAISERNAERQYTLGVSLLRWLKTEIVILFSVLAYEVVSVAKGESDHVAYILPVLLFFLLVTLVIHVVAMLRSK